MAKLVFLTLSIFCLCNVVLGFFGKTLKYNVHEDPFLDISAKVSPLDVEERWIEQRVDNFNRQDLRTWQMRYLEYNDYFQPGGPIFIYIGGEWTVSAGSIRSGHMFDMARELNGTLFYTEHRYYGRSHPTEDTSTENLKWLTVDQALADLAKFIIFVRRNYEGMENSKVIMVGASYSATMVTWFRQKYPHLVAGVWSSSAPLHAQLDFVEYKEVVTESINLMSGRRCLTRFENAFAEMERLIASGDASKIQRDFNLCHPINVNDKMDVWNFFWEVSDTIAGLVQTHRSGNIERACAYINVDTHDDDVSAIGSWMTLNQRNCQDLSYQNSLNLFGNSTWGSVGNQQMRQWTYQTCAEYAWFQTSNSINHVFGSSFPLEFFIQICDDLYDGIFSSKEVEFNVHRSNVIYGGFLPAVTNVYSTHGQLDPWRPMGVERDINEHSPTVILPFASHVSDLGSISLNDSPEMVASKLRVKELVWKWLNIDDELTN